MGGLPGDSVLAGRVALVTGAARNELGPRGVRIVTAYPFRRLGRPEDIAATVVFLASDAAVWITGTIIDVNGGMRAFSAEEAAYRAQELQNGAPTWRARIKRFGGRIRR